MKKRIMIISIIVIILITALLLSGFLTFEFELNKQDSTEILLNQIPSDEGYNAKIWGMKLNKFVTTKEIPNTNKIGKYDYCYQLKLLFINKNICRTYIIKDNINPELKLIGKEEVSYYLNETYEELGYEVSDNHDKKVNVTVTNNIDNTKEGTYEVKYVATDSSNNQTTIIRKVIFKEKTIAKVPVTVPNTNPSSNNEKDWYTEIIPGPTYIKDILIVNKKYSLPESYNYGIDKTAKAALDKMFAAALVDGHSMKLVSGYRSFAQQKTIYNNKVAARGVEASDKVSARPGHSEHQTGLAFDIDQLNSDYAKTPNGIWLKENCHLYGFIIRYPENKSDITGYSFEPWHIRYVGVEHATNIYNENITLEEYLGI